ncbi:DUF4450 domain-containing protein [Hufsiella ginkgonis]|uniref:DUF4450 domain-containing protein n=1 Tax=Hufsiella ginkgonis TaxID=2695274 RepID=A0A7K1XYW2_9SPHI|nr:DUF4450 domain-containing protein [Hufsiella ginkgonis]MXV16184.1 DUF4450 domain-containing protein [Hufsiella ginkgonis]
MFPTFSRSVLVLMLLFSAPLIRGQELYPVQLAPGYWHNISRALRYQPDGTDFVITNGNRRFTRALYGGNTAFRIEAGDLPEFALYMPGMGGNLRFGLVSAGGARWLSASAKIVARYRPGTMIYEITDPALGKATLHLTVLARVDAEGLVAKTWITGTAAKLPGLCWVYGGADGKKFSRDGDMGPDPESVFYLKPENCAGNRYQLSANIFTLTYGQEKTVNGIFPTGAELKIGDAAAVEPGAILSSAEKQAPVLTGKIELAVGKNLYFALQNAAVPAGGYNDLQVIFDQAEAARRKLAERVIVRTPDPYINTLGGALAIASDAIWEEPTYLHGAIGWRSRLNGWRGPYTADPLGWHDRAKMHFRSYAQSQLTSPPDGPSVPDTAFNLARQKEKIGTAVFTSGYISRDPAGKSLRAHHYDMNLVYIDELLRHLKWTGDLDFAREMWPVITRHLAWEKRNFDGNGDGLYDAYAAIWASDALQYSGGGVTHTSAYNYYANKMTAVIAKLIGEDPAPYLAESAKILAAMNSQLWIAQKGVYAEYKDLLGLQLLHPAPALWTIYHSQDSEVPDLFQAYQQLRYTDLEIPHIPVRADGLPEGFYTLSTSNWMPYNWSLNNVALAESMHTTLANWQAGRSEEAFRLWKSELISSMYLGGSPGNIVQISYYDANRGEAYRDFGDPVGMVSRTLVEGLFGIVPDALSQTLGIRPGLPAAWNTASLTIPDLSFRFNRTGNREIYTIVPSFGKPMKLKLRLKARRDQLVTVKVNGKSTAWVRQEDVAGQPMVEIFSQPATSYRVELTWGTTPVTIPAVKPKYVKGEEIELDLKKSVFHKLEDPQKVFDNVKPLPGKLQATVTGEKGNHTIFLKLSQGQMTWWYPVCFGITDAVSVTTPAPQGEGLRLKVTNNTSAVLPCTVKVNGFAAPLSLPAGEEGPEIAVPGRYLFTGSNRVVVSFGKDSVEQNIVNWNITSSRQAEAIDLFASFNDKVTAIFKNKYLSPRAPYPTLQLPVQGAGEWTHPLETPSVDDSGIIRLAGSAGQFRFKAIPFRVPGDAEARNIIFTSRWDNYPEEKTIPLSGKSPHAYFLLAGSTNPMQSRIANGELIVTYTDGSSAKMALSNPGNWWPIERDYLDDGYAFSTGAAYPPRIHLKTGRIVSNASEFNGKEIPGGAAIILDLPLDAAKTLQSITLRTLANDVVMGLMGVTLIREP